MRKITIAQAFSRKEINLGLFSLPDCFKSMEINNAGQKSWNNSRFTPSPNYNVDF